MISYPGFFVVFFFSKQCEGVAFSYPNVEEGDTNFTTSLTFVRSQYNFVVSVIWYVLAVLHVLQMPNADCYNWAFKLLCKQQAVQNSVSSQFA